MGNIEDEEMLSTFNCGVGLIIVVSQEKKEEVMQSVGACHDCYEIGKITAGQKKVTFRGKMKFV
jgi:phosphoribosylformylglycinamidine cyclo-ligase